MGLAYVDKKNSEALSVAFLIKDAKKKAADLFTSIGIDSGPLDAQLLLAHCLKESRLFIQLNGDRRLFGSEAEYFWSLVSRRLCFEPVAYILGEKEFYGLSLSVGRECLIPRPDTESVVSECLSLLEPINNPLVIDLGTGSGAVALAILSAHASAYLKASDVCEKTLKLAAKNAWDLGFSERITFYLGDLFAPFESALRVDLVDLIVSNPPYIATDVIANLACDIKDYEPRVALDGGLGLGLDFYRRILKQAPSILKPNGYLVLEIGYNQEQALASYISDEWRNHRFFKDLSQNTRGLVLQKK